MKSKPILGFKAIEVLKLCRIYKMSAHIFTKCKYYFSDFDLGTIRKQLSSTWRFKTLITKHKLNITVELLDSTKFLSRRTTLNLKSKVGVWSKTKLWSFRAWRCSCLLLSSTSSLWVRNRLLYFKTRNLKDLEQAVRGHSRAMPESQKLLRKWT